MLTRPEVHYRGPAGGLLIVLALAVLAVTGLSVAMEVGRADTAGNGGPLPADLGRLGLEATEAAVGTAPVSAAKAIEAAWAVASNLRDQSPVVEAYLVTATDPSWVGAGEFKDRMIWIVRFSGLDLFFPGVPPGDGTEAKGHTAHFAYVLVDAQTSEAIDYQYWE